MSTRRSADKFYRVVVHRFVDGRDKVIKRLHFATMVDAESAAEKIQVRGDEQVDIVVPLFHELAGGIDDPEILS